MADASIISRWVAARQAASFFGSSRSLAAGSGRNVSASLAEANHVHGLLLGLFLRLRVETVEIEVLNFDALQVELAQKRLHRYVGATRNTRRAQSVPPGLSAARPGGQIDGVVLR